MKTPVSTLRRWALSAVVLALLVTWALPAGDANAQAPELASCGPPPAAANWTINVSCEISANTIAPQNVTITNNATVTIFGGRWLNVDFTNSYLRILPGSKLLIRPGARLYTLPLGHTFLNNTDGVFGYYLKRVDGAVMESYNPTFAFYPASTIKVLQHLHAMRAVDAGTVTLGGTNLNVCSGGVNCSDNANTAALCGGAIVVETLQTALTNMMRPSNNQSTNAIQELFGNGTPSVGRAAMNTTAWTTVAMSNSTALEHKFACGNVVTNDPFNTATLVDLGLLYEEAMTNDAVLPEPTRTTFVQIMLNDTNDGSLVTAINAIVDQEAALIEMPAADIQAFKNGIQFAHKAGNVQGTAYESDAGWVSLPVNNGLDARQYVFGHFVDAATVNTLPSFDARTSELLRTAIRESLPLY
jgi:beta-lactamase class A